MTICSLVYHARMKARPLQSDRVAEITRAQARTAAARARRSREIERA